MTSYLCPCNFLIIFPTRRTSWQKHEFYDLQNMRHICLNIHWCSCLIYLPLRSRVPLLSYRTSKIDLLIFLYPFMAGYIQVLCSFLEYADLSFISSLLSLPCRLLYVYVVCMFVCMVCDSLLHYCKLLPATSHAWFAGANSFLFYFLF